MLNLGLANESFSQNGTSASYGNTFIHHDVEVVIHGYHNFEIGSLQVHPGIVGTERRSPRGYLGFTKTSDFGGADDQAHIDGYVRFHGEGRMVLPIGDNGIYAPLETDQKSGTLGTSYYNANPAIAVTDQLNGDAYAPLPEGGPFNIENHGPDISFISDYEYWHIEGDADTKITLYYNPDSGLEKLTNGAAEDLTMVGWSGSSWEVIPSKIVASTLGENLKEGSIKTLEYITPSQYSILTFASLGSREITKGNISGIAWEDYNGDGIKQNNEPPLSKADLFLEECDPTKASISTTTDSEGRYSFDGLEDGFYRIVFSREDLVSGLDITVIPTENFGEINNDFLRTGMSACLEVKFGSIYNSIDLGLLSLGNIGDLVWEDVNNNGLYDSDESGVANVVINLMQNDSLISSTTTTENGSYAFNNVYPGEYYLQFEQPGDYAFANHDPNANKDLNSDVDHSNGPGTTYTFDLNSGDTFLDLDAGLSTCNSVSDYVWIDRDKNNIYNEGDFRMPDVTVNIYKSSDSQNILYASSITNGDGQYEFCVGPGDYYLEFVRPESQYEFATPFIGDNDIIDSDVDNSNGDGTTQIFTVNGSQAITGLSAGLNSEDFVGTIVWLDLNRDGIRQNFEPGIEGMVIDLYNSNHILQATQTSDAEGRITFKELGEGMYYMRAQDLGDYLFTTAFAGNDKTIDNNFDESNGKYSSASFEVVKGYSNPNIDLGLMNDECLFTPLAYDLRMGMEGVEVVWETNLENTVSHYVVEKKTGDQYTELRSYNPNGEDHQIYGYVDRDYTNGETATYRLIAYSLDGTACISLDQSIDIPEADVVIDAFDEDDYVIRPNELDNPCDIAPTNVYFKMINNQPQFIWVTSDESRINHYVLQRKLRISDRYISLDTIVSDRKPNQIYGEIDYSKLLPGNYYYRLVTYGTEGEECISEVINVVIEDESKLPYTVLEIEEDETIPFKPEAVSVDEVLLYPNPAIDFTNLQVTVDGLSFIEVSIFDTEGKEVMKEVVNGMINEREVTFKIPIIDLKSGIYFIRTEINGKVVVRKLVKQQVISNR